jgi:hypothetical protein
MGVNTTRIGLDSQLLLALPLKREGSDATQVKARQSDTKSLGKRSADQRDQG